MGPARADVETARPTELGMPELRAWRTVQAAEPDLSNPFLAPEFALAVGAARPGARVAVRRGAAGPDAFFAFELAGDGIVRRIGSGLSDQQAVVCRSHEPWDLRDLLARVGAYAVRLENVPVDRLPPSARRVVRYASPVMDLSEGYEAYAASRRAVSRSMMSTAMRKKRKLEREVGPIRFEFDARDPLALHTVMRWKSGQYARLGEWDRFAAPDVVETVERLADSRAPGCTGTLSLLWAGDTLAAAHFGPRSERILCSWFPTYNPDLARYSPGLLLHLMMAEAAAARGIATFDLGRGDHGYKTLLASHEPQLARAAVFRRNPAGLAHGLASAPLDYARVWGARSPRVHATLVRVRDGLAAVRRLPAPGVPAAPPRDVPAPRPSRENDVRVAAERAG